LEEKEKNCRLKTKGGHSVFQVQVLSEDEDEDGIQLLTRRRGTTSTGKAQTDLLSRDTGRWP